MDLREYHWHDHDSDFPSLYSMYLLGKDKSYYLLSDFNAKMNKWGIRYNPPIPPGIIVAHHSDHLYQQICDYNTGHAWLKVDVRDEDISNLVQEVANKFYAAPHPSIDKDPKVYVPKDLLREWRIHPDEYLHHIIEKYLPKP